MSFHHRHHCRCHQPHAPRHRHRHSRPRQASSGLGVGAVVLLFLLVLFVMGKGQGTAGPLFSPGQTQLPVAVPEGGQQLSVWPSPPQTEPLVAEEPLTVEAEEPGQGEHEAQVGNEELGGIPPDLQAGCRATCRQAFAEYASAPAGKALVVSVGQVQAFWVGGESSISLAIEKALAQCHQALGDAAGCRVELIEGEPAE